MVEIYARRDTMHSGTYQILRCAGDLAIHCEICDRTSFSHWDVEHRYCGHCHVFHHDRMRALAPRPHRAAQPSRAWGCALLLRICAPAQNPEPKTGNRSV